MTEPSKETKSKTGAKKAAKPRAKKAVTPKRSTKKPSSKGGKKNVLKLKLVRSLIGATERQRQCVRGLGLRRLQHTVERQDTPEIRGMVRKVAHLVQVIEG